MSVDTPILSEGGMGAGPDAVKNTTTADFMRDVVDASREVPVLVDFWAPWCGPCRTVAPIVDELANQYAGKIKVAKVNVDESQQVAFQYQVTSIPTFILFKDGRVADRVLGALPRSEFIKFIDRNIQ